VYRNALLTPTPTPQVGALLNAYNFKARLMAVAGQAAFGSTCEFDWPTGSPPSLAQPYLIQAYLPPEGDSNATGSAESRHALLPYMDKV